MPVIERAGNLFSSDAQVLAHGVNTIGVMGAGIATEFARRYPGMYSEYKKLCESGRLVTGKVYAYREPDDGRWVFNLATQGLPGRNAELYRVEEAVSSAMFIMDALALTSIALPRIGSGIGGLDWADVKNEIERVAKYYPHITVELWTYNG